MEIILYNCNVFISCNVMIADEIGMNAKQIASSDLPKVEAEQGVVAE